MGLVIMFKAVFAAIVFASFLRTAQKSLIFNLSKKLV